MTICSDFDRIWRVFGAKQLPKEWAPADYAATWAFNFVATNLIGVSASGP